ncbi:MAG: hypothetical protein ACQEQC_04280, partial [Elusimicrobiota bacterium]
MNINIKKTGDNFFKAGLVLLAVSLPLSIFLMGVATGLLGVAFLIKFFNKELNFINTGLDIPLGLFLLAFIISALFSSDAPLHSLEYIWFNYGWIFCMYF